MLVPPTSGSPKWCAKSSPDQTQGSWVPCASEPSGTSPMSQSRVSHRTGPWWAGQPLSSFPQTTVVPLFWMGRTVLVPSLPALSPNWLQDVKARRWGRLWRRAPPSGKSSDIMMAVSVGMFSSGEEWEENHQEGLNPGLNLAFLLNSWVQFHTSAFSKRSRQAYKGGCPCVVGTERCVTFVCVAE